MRKKIKIYLLGTAIVVSYCLFITGCTSSSESRFEQLESYPDGTVKREKRIADNDTIGYTYRDYYPTGTIESEYSMKGNLVHGFNRNYYQNGKIDFEGNWVLGKKTGFFKYYDSLGNLNKIIEFLPFRDTAIDRPNQFFRIGQYGDTLLNGQSLYYEYYSAGDTINNGQPYEFKIILKGHLFRKAHIRFCDYDEKFNLLSENGCQGTEMENLEVHLKTTHYKPGENFLRGVIINYEPPKSKNEGVAKKLVEVYFSHRYYVR